MAPARETRKPEPALAASGSGVRKVRKAYEQVADQLREMIHGGALARGARLPTEQALAQQFGVSRATVREAIRVLATEALVVTAKGGAAPGSYVTRPSIAHISELLDANVALLSQTDRVTLEDFLEAREYLEIPAARLAALRRGPDDLHRLHGAIPEPLESLGVDDQFAHDRSFHAAVVEASGNALLRIAARPVFSLLESSLARSALEPAVRRRIVDDHRQLAQAIEAGDANGAERAMREHLRFLRPQYERVWQRARKRGR